MSTYCDTSKRCKFSAFKSRRLPTNPPTAEMLRGSGLRKTGLITRVSAVAAGRPLAAAANDAAPTTREKSRRVSDRVCMVVSTSFYSRNREARAIALRENSTSPMMLRGTIFFLLTSLLVAQVRGPLHPAQAAISELRAGRYSAAQQILEEALKQSPADAQLWTLNGFALVHL